MQNTSKSRTSKQEAKPTQTCSDSLPAYSSGWRACPISSYCTPCENQKLHTLEQLHQHHVRIMLNNHQLTSQFSPGRGIGEGRGELGGGGRSVIPLIGTCTVPGIQSHFPINSHICFIGNPSKSPGPGCLKVFEFVHLL